MNRPRSGYTTGACAAAAARAAAERLLLADRRMSASITLPAGGRATFRLKTKRLREGVAYASVVKDAGDDPDVTNGAEIGAEVRVASRKAGIKVRGGHGVGKVTRPGLSVRPGLPAINPVPMKMIRGEVREVLRSLENPVALDVTIVVPRGRELALKTLNARLGILGGISILGTTGIVTPLSADAWRATIAASFSVARAAGLKTVVCSSGRASERAHMKRFGMPEEAYVLSGDHVAWSLVEAGRYGFSTIHLVAQWAKMLKIAMGAPDTHVRSGVLDIELALPFLRSLGMNPPQKKYNTAREIFEGLGSPRLGLRVCARAGEYASTVAGVPVTAMLVTYGGEVLDGDA